MLKHADIWAAIDRLAEENGLTASGLARHAGLDPTTFNRSKRTTREGKARWPSTESISKILQATGTNLAHFVGLIRADTPIPAQRRLPMSRVEALAQGDHFDAAGRPAGHDWSAIDLPEVADSQAFAVEVKGNAFEPAYHDGDILIVSPATPARPGDRVFVRTQDHDIVIARLLRRSPRRYDLEQLSKDGGELSLRKESVNLFGRIVWVSQ